jgi:hypothetical protein
VQLCNCFQLRRAVCLSGLLGRSDFRHCIYSRSHASESHPFSLRRPRHTEHYFIGRSRYQHDVGWMGQWSSSSSPPKLDPATCALPARVCLSIPRGRKLRTRHNVVSGLPSSHSGVHAWRLDFSARPQAALSERENCRGSVILALLSSISHWTGTYSDRLSNPAITRYCST